MASNQGLYDPSFEHDSCGIGFIANIKGNKSHQIISDSLTVLENMEHRGACGCESNTGDGAGILLQTPHEFFFEECLKSGVHLPSYGKYGVGVIFFPKEIRLREECRDIFNRAAERLGMDVLLYRKVPVNPDGIGLTALSVEPEIEQVFIACPDHLKNPEEFERKLFVLRNHATHLINNTVRKDAIGFYIASLSYKTDLYEEEVIANVVNNLKKLQKADAGLPVFKTVASKNAGIDKVLAFIQSNTNKRNSRKQLLLAEKAYRIIQQKRMAGIDKKKLQQDIAKALKEPGFNLYKFISPLTP